MCFKRGHHRKGEKEGKAMGMQSISNFMVSLELPKQYFGEEGVELKM